MRFFSFPAAVLSLLICAPIAAHATPVTALGDFTPTAPVVTFEDIPVGTAGPLIFGDLTLTSPGQTVYGGGYTQYPGIFEGQSFGFGVATFTLDFAVDVQAVGLGLFDANFVTTRLEVFNRAGDLFETIIPAKGPPGGTFSTYTGVMRSQGDIARVMVIPQSGDLLSIDTIGWAESPATVPLPPAAALLLGGFSLLGLRRRRADMSA